ncbi:MAG: TlpA disulfide reductase family protein [Bacillus sp. (in: firmicutes)]
MVVNFWASWCGPCKIEAPELVSLNRKYHNQVKIYAVNLTSGDSESEARAFAEEYGFNFPVLLDKDGKVAKLYNVAAIPTTYFISSDGIIVDRIIGFRGKDALKSKFNNLVKAEE